MVILSISNLRNNQWAGININVPKYVKYLQSHATSGYLNCSSLVVDNLKEYENYFTIDSIKNYDISFLPEPFNKPDLVVFHEVYEIAFVRIANNLRKQNIPYVIIPRCSLTAQGQKKSYLKKKVANFLIFRKFIEKASFIHFLTKNEYLESKDSFNIKNHMVAGNGMEMPLKKHSCNQRDEFKILFIGRYDWYHKGLDVLLEAINKEKEYFTENKIKFVFYGHDCDNTLKYMNNYIEQNELSSLIELNNAIFGEKKEEAILDADIFIHTSRLEGHPTSVIEAISYGVPVIVTPGTNVVEDVKNNKLGFTCELIAEDISKTIIKSYESKDKLEQISENEVGYAKEEFDWNNIIIKMIKEYKKILKI